MDNLRLLFTLLALLVLIVLAWATFRFFLNLSKRGKSGGLIKFRYSHYLSAKERLVVVEYKGQDLLLGVGAGSVTLLDRSEASIGKMNDPKDGNDKSAASPGPLS